ncbi:phospholipase A1-Ibeta2, chloroplastic-like [Hordeum vulgare]|nr:phospholipase A1-Ibeta2, chloroplastic-like [Hordeum vulgare]
MTSIAAPPTSLHRPAVSATHASRASVAAPSNRVHLGNLEHLFRNRGAVESSGTAAAPVQPARRRQQAPLLRLPSFFKRAKGDFAVAKEEQVDLSPRLFQPVPPDGPSPRGDIAAAWRRLHGEDGWRGLLDPLHPDLRREIVRYGEFVDAAYGAFLSQPDAVPGDGTGAVHVPLQDAAYRERRHCSRPRPWASRPGSRLPRRVPHSARASSENFRAGLVPATEAVDAAASPVSASDPKVECGFRNLYKTAGDGSPSLSEMVVTEVRRLLKKYEGEEVSITVTGHSLGAALAVLIADELAGHGGAPTPVAVFSFGGPRVGNHAFAERVEARGARVLRVVNAHDVVPQLPPRPGGRWYADVGRELRLDSRASPYLRPDADAACCHDLEAYIHLVDGFLSSHCPFRANAKRSILRLLKNQGGNVKQLYISKAMDMRVRLDAGGSVDMPGSPLGRLGAPPSTVLECVH